MVGDDTPDGVGAREGSAGTGGRDGGGGSGAQGGTAASPENGGGDNRSGTGGSEIRGGIVRPGAGGSDGTGATGAIGATGGTVASSPDDTEGCTQDNIRFSVGGNLGRHAPPPGACVQNNMYYCQGESYAVDTGACSGTCTCRGDTTWACTYDNTTSPSCEVPYCDVDGVRLDRGFGFIDSDDCTYCQCTAQGLVCTDDSCHVEARCGDVAGEYALALTRANVCDPKSSAPQCTESAAISVSCDNQIPVADSTELDAIRQRYAEDGCAEISAPCPPHVSIGTHPSCEPDGVCRNVP